MATSTTTVTKTSNAKGTITTTVVQSKSTVTNTTTVDNTLGKVVTNVSYIPYMRAIDIAHIGIGLRPKRQIYYFFDGQNVTQYIQRPNIIKLDTQKNFNDFIPGPREKVSIVGSNATVFLTETDSTTGNTTLFINQIYNPKTTVVAGNVITGLVSGLSGNVVSYKHNSGYLRPSSNISYLYLALDADGATDNVYVGNTITLVTGPNAGRSSNIISYNCASRIATVSPAFSNVGTSNTIYSIGDHQQLYSANIYQGIWTTSKGFVTGTFHLPDPAANSEYQFLTGDRVLRIIDNPRNDTSNYTTRADYRFTSNGLDVSQTQLVSRVITNNTVTTITDSISNTFIATPQPVVNQPAVVEHSNMLSPIPDPIAQSFYIDPLIYPDGIFVPSISVFFKNKDSFLPIQMQIRPLTNGLPDSSQVLPGAISILQPEEVTLTNSPDASNTATATTFTFPSPVYLYPGQNYAFVVLTDSYAYDIYISELGQKILGTSRLVSEQPYLGSMFKSQSAVTYTAIQSQDIMFVINKCVFNSAGNIDFMEQKSLNPSSTGNSYMDIFQVHSDSAQLPETSISYAFKATSNSNSAFDSIYTNLTPDSNFLLDTRKIVYGPDVPTQSFDMKIAMATNNPDVSPIVFKNRQVLVAVENKINNLPLTNAIVIIANTGNGYFSSNTSLSFTSNTGTGANGYIVANTNGGIDAVIIDNGGFGYKDNTTVTVTSSTGTNASILVVSETGRSGGPAAFRWMSETVTLADNFDAGDLRVYLTAIKPQAASIDVYYKVKNSLDSETIDDKSWFKMAQVTAAEIVSLNLNDPIEYQYAPSVSSNNIVYSTNTATYTTFNQFKIKIVGSSSDTVAYAIPYIQDMRAIALVADVF